MENPKPVKINTIRYLATSYFILIAVINIADSFINGSQTKTFDAVFLVFVCLPLLIKSRMFIFGYGLLAAILSFTILLIYLTLYSPRINDFPMFYVLGIIVFAAAFISSLALLYVGTHSKEKGRFELI